MSNSTSEEVDLYSPVGSLFLGSCALVCCFVMIRSFVRLTNRLVKNKYGNLEKLIPTHPMARSDAIKSTVQFVPLEKDSGKPFQDPVNAKVGIVVKIEDAINIMPELDLLQEKWKDDPYNKHKPFLRVQRYEVDLKCPFVMLSYQAVLKDSQNDRDSLKELLERLKEEGWTYLWWDWLVIDPTYDYQQEEFEKVMKWASDSCTMMAIAWPTVKDALNYLNRPWCIAESIVACERKVHCFYVREDFTDTLDLGVARGQAQLVLALALFGVYFLTDGISLAMQYVLDQNDDPPFMIRHYNEEGDWVMYDGWPLIQNRAVAWGGLIYAILLTPIYAYICSIELDMWVWGYHKYRFPYGAVKLMLEDGRDRQSKLRLLQQNGHITGGMYNPTDAPAAAAVLEISKVQFTFEQASRKFDMEINKGYTCGISGYGPLVPDRGKGIKNLSNRDIIGANASWYDGVDADGEWEAVRAITENFSGQVGLYKSTPVGTQKSGNYGLVFGMPAEVRLNHLLASGEPNKFNSFTYALRTVTFIHLAFIPIALEIVIAMVGPETWYFSGRDEKETHAAAYIVCLLLLVFHYTILSTPHYLLAQGHLTIVGDMGNMKTILFEICLAYVHNFMALTQMLITASDTGGFKMLAFLNFLVTVAIFASFYDGAPISPSIRSFFNTRHIC